MVACRISRSVIRTTPFSAVKGYGVYLFFLIMFTFTWIMMEYGGENMVGFNVIVQHFGKSLLYSYICLINNTSFIIFCDYHTV